MNISVYNVICKYYLSFVTTIEPKIELTDIFGKYRVEAVTKALFPLNVNNFDRLT